MRNLSLALAVLALGACKMTEGPVPAVLESANAVSVDALKSSLAGAMGQANVQLGPEDLATSSSVSVLPPRLGPNETRSMAMPEQFDLVMQGGDCMLIHRKTGETHPLRGVACRPA